MEKDRFACDRGFVSSHFLNLYNVHNLTELLWSEELVGALRLCGIPERELCDSASNYERFSALCKAFPLLEGHSWYRRINAFMRTYFPSLPMLCEENCAHVWQQTAQAFMEKPHRPIDFLPTEPTNCLLKTLDVEALPAHFIPMLDANLFTETACRTYRDWRSYIRDAIERFAKAGAREVSLSLHSSFAFCKPDPYHVDLALVGRCENAADVLFSQLFRELCEACKEQGQALLLTLDCKGKDAVSLLQYANRTVGLPHVDWCPSRENALDVIAFFSQTPYLSSNRCLRLSDYPTDVALENAVSEIVTEYPSGCLRFLSDCDLRFQFAERQRALAALQKSLQKTKK